MQNAQQEEFKHFGMDLEFLLRRIPQRRTIMQDILFQEGDIVAHGKQAENDDKTSMHSTNEVGGEESLHPTSSSVRPWCIVHGEVNPKVSQEVALKI